MAFRFTYITFKRITIRSLRSLDEHREHGD